MLSRGVFSQPKGPAKAHHSQSLDCPQLIIMRVGMVQEETMKPSKRQDLEMAERKMGRGVRDKQ